MSDRDGSKLCLEERNILSKEINVFVDVLNLGLHDELIDLTGAFLALTEKLRDSCPLIYDIMSQLLLAKPSGRGIQEGRVRSASHVLAILVGMKSQKG